MNVLKSHFRFSKKQRNGILFLIAIVIGLQVALFFLRSSTEENNLENHELINAYRAEVDSLKQIALQESKPKRYPFNPNFITDYKGYTLGMSNEEINRLLEFREKNQWINSAKQFQDVTKVSDSLLVELLPWFKFPEWITNPKPKRKTTFFSNNVEPKTFNQKIDLNLATAEQLKRVNGIGEKLSQRIVKYRQKIGSFTSEVQLSEVYGLSNEVIEYLKMDFVVKTPKAINKINLNTANAEKLVLIPHIDYEVAYFILEQRALREGFKSLDELMKVKEFPIDKIEIIKLYLTLD